eukprot:m.189206 g.189206  ORF g.189206 m.189206 type:complete len:98 (-) comp15103_c0_seq1:91-384(-)
MGLRFAQLPSARSLINTILLTSRGTVETIERPTTLVLYNFGSKFGWSRYFLNTATVQCTCGSLEFDWRTTLQVLLRARSRKSITLSNFSSEYHKKRS